MSIRQTRLRWQLPIRAQSRGRPVIIVVVVEVECRHPRSDGLKLPLAHDRIPAIHAIAEGALGTLETMLGEVIPHNGSTAIDSACLPLLMPLNQVREELRLLGALDEAMAEEFLGAGPVLGVLDETEVDKVLERGGEVALENGRFGFGNEEEDSHGVVFCQGRLAFGHFDGRDAERPDVRLGIIACLSNDLWRHPEGCAHECVAARLVVAQLGGDTKVGELDFARGGEEDIGGLDVAVDLAFVVEVFETKEELATDDCDVLF